MLKSCCASEFFEDACAPPFAMAPLGTRQTAAVARTATTPLRVSVRSNMGSPPIHLVYGAPKAQPVTRPGPGGRAGATLFDLRPGVKQPGGTTTHPSVRRGGAGVA